MFLDVPVVNQKTDKTESYLINTDNINYLRRWTDDKTGHLQTVVYFTSSQKYLVVDMERDTLAGMIVGKTAKLSAPQS